MTRFLMLCSVLLLSACASSSKPTPAAQGHPANPDSPTAARPTPMPAAHDSADGHQRDHAGRDHNAPAAQPASPGAMYVCPMHPAVTSNDPEARCPECGMKINKKVAPPTTENPR